MKTASDLADEFVDTFTWPYSERIEISATVLADTLTAAIEAARSELVGNIESARASINATYDAAEGDSNDSEIAVLQDVRDSFHRIVEAVGGTWEHEPLAPDTECDYCSNLATGTHEGDNVCDEHAPVPVEDQCDECEEEATNRWPELKSPVQLCDSCEHNARRSGWEPGQ